MQLPCVNVHQLHIWRLLTDVVGQDVSQRGSFLSLLLLRTFPRFLLSIPFLFAVLYRLNTNLPINDSFYWVRSNFQNELTAGSCMRRMSWKMTSRIFYGVSYIGCCGTVWANVSLCAYVRCSWLGLVRVLRIHTLDAQLESRCAFSHRDLLPWFPVRTKLYLKYDSSHRGENQQNTQTHQQDCVSEISLNGIYYVFLLRRWWLAMETQAM